MSARVLPTWALGAAGIVVIAAVLRLYRLGEADLWFDEAVMALAARGGPAEVLDQTREHVATPILYPLLLSLIQQVEPSAFGVRLPSAVFGVVAVAILAVLPRVGVPSGAALAASFLLAVGNFQVFYSRETREYALSVLVSAAFVYALLAWARAPRAPYAALGLCALAAFAPFASYPSWFAALGSIAALFISRADGWRTGAPALACFALAACVSFALSVQHQIGLASASYMDEHFLARSGMPAPLWLAMNSGAVFIYASPGLIAAIFVAGLCAAALISRRDVVSIAGALAFAGVALGGALGIYAFGSPRHSIFLAPFLLVSAASMGGALLARIPARIRPWTIGLTCLIGLASAAIAFARVPLLADAHPAFVRLASFDVYGEREDIRGPAALARMHSGALLYASAGAVPALRFHAPDLSFAGGGAADGPGMAREMIAAGARIAIFAHVPPGEDERAIEAMRAARFVVMEDRVFAGSRFVAFARRPQPL